MHPSTLLEALYRYAALCALPLEGKLATERERKRGREGGRERGRESFCTSLHEPRNLCLGGHLKIGSITAVPTHSDKQSYLAYSFSPTSLFIHGKLTPFDSRRLQSQKAAAVYNPITQKGIPQPQANGDISQQKPVASSKPGVIKDAVNVDKQAHDRLAFILAACTVGWRNDL